MQQLGRLVGRKLGERHVVRDSRVVDQHGDGLRRARLPDHGHAGVGAEVSHQRTDPDIRKRGGELVEPVTAPAGNQQVIPFATEALGKGPADARGGAGHERQAGQAGITVLASPASSSCGI